MKTTISGKTFQVTHTRAGELHGVSVSCNSTRLYHVDCGDDYHHAVQTKQTIQDVLINVKQAIESA